MTTTTITAGEVMTGFVAAEPSDTLGEVAERMREANAGSALVIDYGRLVGILTSRDMLRAVAERTHSSEARARMDDARTTGRPRGHAGGRSSAHHG